MSLSPIFTVLEQASDSSSKTGFNDLPRELRDVICRLALVEPASVRGFRHPQEICLSHSTGGRGGCNTRHTRHSDTRENFQALILVSRMVRREAIEMLPKHVKFTCWMPLNDVGEPRKHDIRMGVFLRHAPGLQIRRGSNEVPRTFEIAIVDSVWQVKPDGCRVPKEIVKDWAEALQRLLKDHDDVQGRFSKHNLMVLRKCLVRADSVISEAAHKSPRRQGVARK
ncbi:hypothetical protein AC579_3415 [Pseudocercospora musae]|uniref:Uncharacterized protein n=1 Tax=Pseudocercospora musae TaxID=113226 RepID=A0A139IL47_9PEZI|nr:hypothetical protein AC579_3415 [Pseudocercospora musae]